MSEAASSGPSAPTVLRIILGKRLKALREAGGVSFDDAAKTLGVTPLTIRRMENAQVGLKVPYVKELLRRYGVEDEIDDFIEMAEKANKPGWWHPFRDSVPDWFRAYVALETDARVIRVYEPHYVTGLLQTRDYARGVIRAGFPYESDEQLEHRVELRVRRQGLLDRADAPTMWVVLEETALRRGIGGPEVMREQLDRIIEMSERPNFTLRIVPLAAGPHPTTGGHMTYFRFREPELQDIVYSEVGLTSAVYLDQRADVVAHLEAHTRTSRLASACIPDTRTYLRNLRKELDR